MSSNTPHKDKLLAAIENPKCSGDLNILKEAYSAYNSWVRQMNSLRSIKKDRVIEMTRLLNDYKDYLEVELISRKGTDFIKRQKGQLKLDNSVFEEFLIYLVDPNILNNLPPFDLEIGPKTAFMSLSFRPSRLLGLNGKPEVVLKLKDQDFAIGKTIHYKFSSDPNFIPAKTNQGSLYLAVLAAECKVNLDKTMFQESAGTAATLKQGCPLSKYYILVEYLDMTPEDCRLTEIDNVYLLRRAKRLPYEKRAVFEEVRNQHQKSPIDSEIIWKFVQEIQNFIDAVWYDPDAALNRGSFI
jgi:hypothetical protein